MSDNALQNTKAIGARPWWQVLLLIVGGFLLFMLLYELFRELSFIASRAFPGEAYPAPPASTLPSALAAIFGGAAILVIYACAVRLFEKHAPYDMPLLRCLPDMGKGLIISALYFAVVATLIALAGCYRVESVSFDAGFFFGQLAFFFLIACGEEVIFRGIFFRIVDEKWGTAAALAVSALLFGFFHIANPGATVWSSVAIAIEAGLLLGAAYKFSGTIWLPIGIHWGWNFLEGPVLGFAVSGNETAAGSTVCEAAVSGPDIISGGAFGLEASIFAAVIGLAMSALFIHKIVRR